MRLNKLITLCAVALLLSSQLAVAEHALPEYKAKYSVYYLGIKGAEANYELSYNGNGYRFAQNTHLVGIASLFAKDSVSTYSLIDSIDDKLLLTRHIYIQTGREDNKDEDISITWSTDNGRLDGKVSGVVRSRNISYQVTSPVWEFLSFQVPLMIDATKDRKEYPYDALLKGEIDTYNFVLQSSKMVQYAGKEYQSLQMVRQDPNRDYQLHIWLLPELHNIPVLVENYRDGKIHSSMKLESVTFDDKKTIANNAFEDDDDF